jgi:hypothetical protein
MAALIPEERFRTSVLRLFLAKVLATIKHAIHSLHVTITRMNNNN